MSENRMEGAMHKAKGAAKEAVGKMTDNERLEAEGRTEKVAGEAQNKVGKAQDKIGDAIKHWGQSTFTALGALLFLPPRWGKGRDGGGSRVLMEGRVRH